MAKGGKLSAKFIKGSDAAKTATRTMAGMSLRRPREPGNRRRREEGEHRQRGEACAADVIGGRHVDDPENDDRRDDEKVEIFENAVLEGAPAAIESRLPET